MPLGLAFLPMSYAERSIIRRSLLFFCDNFVIVSMSYLFVFDSVSIKSFLVTAADAKLLSAAITSSAISHCCVIL